MQPALPLLLLALMALLVSHSENPTLSGTIDTLLKRT
jgi:hypothetical protein